MAFAGPKIETNRQQIIEEIDRLRRDLATRRSFDRQAPRSIVNAYHELLERQYIQLDDLRGE